MGDSRRNEIFARFIRQNFPLKRFKSVLVVADGKGELAKYLSKWYKVRVVELKPRQKHFRKKVNYQRGLFEYNHEVPEDFIVAMHPDEATAEVVKSGTRNNKRWAIVPCCVKGIEAHGVKKYQEWIDKLKSLSHREVRETRLKFNGKNRVMWI